MKPEIREQKTDVRELVIGLLIVAVCAALALVALRALRSVEGRAPSRPCVSNGQHALASAQAQRPRQSVALQAASPFVLFVSFVVHPSPAPCLRASVVTAPAALPTVTCHLSTVFPA